MIAKNVIIALQFYNFPNASYTRISSSSRDYKIVIISLQVTCLCLVWDCKNCHHSTSSFMFVKIDFFKQPLHIRHHQNKQSQAINNQVYQVIIWQGHWVRPVAYLTKDLASIIQIRLKYLQLKLKQCDHYKILHMPRQLSCRGMCKNV